MAVAPGRDAKPRRVTDRLRGADPRHAVLKRAVRVTLAALIGFYACLYGLDNASMAVYSLFTTVALGVLSSVGGTPQQRSRTYASAAAVGAVLAVAGTGAAVNDWLAAGGMLVVGFVVALAGVGGPRLVGIANGLQLFYILACFPPYLPDEIGYRLAGIALGAALLTSIDRFLWPDPGPPAFADQLADATDLVAAHAGALADALNDRAAGVQRAAGPGEPAVTCAPPDVCQAADAALDTLLLANVPPLQRPLSAGPRDRGLRHASESLRRVHQQLRRAMVPANAGDARSMALLLQPLSETLRRCAAALRNTGEPPTADAIRVALDSFDEARLRWLADPDPDTAPVELRVGARMTLAAGGSLATVEACRAAVGAPVDVPALAAAGPPRNDNLSPFAYANRPVRKLYWDRLSWHLTRRSVLLQNAVRTAIVLAAARLVAAALDLSHGFWVLLATLSLMRTSAADTRTALRPAFVGTLAGALIGGAVITAVGPERDVYAGITPFVLVGAFALGPILGVAWAQGGFALVVSFLFMQVAPSNWHLAEARLIDVVVGGLTGAVAGLLAWPRGGSGEVCRSAAAFLRTDAAALRATAMDLLGVGDPDAAQVADVAARRALLLADASNIQYHSERQDPRLDAAALHDALDLGRFILRAGEFLRMRYAKRPEHAVAGAELVESAAGDAAALATEFAAALTARRPPQPSAAGDPIAVETAWLLRRQSRPAAEGASAPQPAITHDVVRVADVEAWLAAVIRYRGSSPAFEQAPVMTPAK